MTRTGGLPPPSTIASLLLVATACKQGPAPDSPSGETKNTCAGTGENDCPGCGCDREPSTDCPAGDLPRLTEKDWSPVELEHLMARTAEGTVAVVRSADGTRLLSECHLDGAYTEVQGEAKSGRFWATDRVMFKPGELVGSCSTATHEVAAFAVSGPHFSILLVPLPCPPLSDTAAAAGCLGRGLTGPEREKRALEIRDKSPQDPGMEDLASRFEVYALMPEERGISYLGHYKKHPLDCYLGAQLNRLTSSEPPSKWPRFTTVTWATCDMWPPFMTCFPGLFDPAPGGSSCWRPAKS